MKLYRVEITHDTDFEPGEWSSELAIVKKEYAEKRGSFDEDDYAYEDDSIAIVSIEVPEEVIEEFERETEVLQKEVVALEPEEDGYTHWYWHKERQDGKN